LRTVGSYVFPYFYGRLQHHPFGNHPFEWTYSPGWITPLCLFFAVASIGGLKSGGRVVPGALWAISLLTLAKIFNCPVIKWAGNLPFLELTIFPRYGAFMPAFGIAALSAFGVSFLARETYRRLLFWLIIWTVLVCGIFAVAVITIWTPLWLAAQDSEARNTFL